MLGALFRLIGTDKENDLKFNYYVNFLPNFTSSEIKDLNNGRKVKKYKTIDGKRVHFKCGFCSTQQNNGRRSVYITITFGDKRTSYHGIYTLKNGETHNYGVGIYKKKGTHKKGFALFENTGEKCYMGHHGLEDGKVHKKYTKYVSLKK